MRTLDFLEDELDYPSVFEDESKLSSQYIPENLPFRTEELKSLVRFFRGLFSSGGDSKKMVVYGSVGTGKTSVAKKFGIWAQDRSGVKSTISYIHINCRNNRSPYTILLAVARELNSHVPTRGYSSQELMDMIVDLLEAKGISLLLVLDEIDYVYHEELSNLIYSLTRSNDVKQEIIHHISLILISRNLNFLHYIDNSTKSTLAAAKLELKPYSMDQLSKILEDRIGDSFKQGGVTTDSISLTSKIASKHGDARQALELLWYAGKYADQVGSSIVYPDHIRHAKSNLQPDLIKKTVHNLKLHQLLLTQAIARQLHTSKAAYLTTGIVHEAYLRICEEYQQEPRKNTQLWEYLKDLTKLGVVSSMKSGAGQRGQTHYISLEDVSATELDKEVNTLLDRIQLNLEK